MNTPIIGKKDNAIDPNVVQNILTRTLRACDQLSATPSEVAVVAINLLSQMINHCTQNGLDFPIALALGFPTNEVLHELIVAYECKVVKKTPTSITTPIRHVVMFKNEDGTYKAAPLKPACKDPNCNEVEH